MVIVLPVGNIDVDDASLQEFPIQVSACSQDPALVVRQTVSNKQHVVFLRRLPKCLPELRLLVLYWCENERGCIQTQTFRPLRIGREDVKIKDHVVLNKCR